MTSSQSALSRPLRLLCMLLGASQIQAACNYSPPPVLSHGQGAESLGSRRLAVGAEAGFGTTASYWKADNLSDPDVNSGLVGAARLRVGVSADIDVGLVGGMGPDRTFVLGPEGKWRFARLSPGREEAPSDGGAIPDADRAPSFDAAIIAGLGIGTAAHRYEGESELGPNHPFLAPYQGFMASGGVQVIQMSVGLRLAESETLGNDVADLTLYPIFAFGAQVRPSRQLALFVELDAGGGIPTADTGDSAFIFFPSAGFSLTFDDVWGAKP